MTCTRINLKQLVFPLSLGVGEKNAKSERLLGKQASKQKGFSSQVLNSTKI